MNRKAIIIYCDDTDSGNLAGPIRDNENYLNFLQSNLGGNWYPHEIKSFRNPTSIVLQSEIFLFTTGADYTFIIFSGHGFINKMDHLQYLELKDKSISIMDLRTSSKRQTLIIDSCRGYYLPVSDQVKGLFSEQYKNAIGNELSTRKKFDESIVDAEEGWTILYAADKDQTALDTNMGGAYLLSLLNVAKQWAKLPSNTNVLTLKQVHESSLSYIRTNYQTIQVPQINTEKRMRHFPFAIKI